MNPATELQKYTDAMGAMVAHQNINSGVFKEHKRLLNVVIDAESLLRDAVAESGANISNSEYKVTITPQTQTYADIEVIDEMIANDSIRCPRERIVKTVTRPARISISGQKDL